MAELTARFRLIDEMSSRLASIAEGGQNAIEQWEQAGDALDAAFEGISSGSASAVSSVDGVAHSVESLQQAMDECDQIVSSGCDNLDELEEAAQNAADATQELDGANRRAAKEAEESSERGQKAAKQLAAALTSAGIAKMVLELADAYMEASEAAAEFEVATMKISTIADTTQVSLSTISGDLLALSIATGESVNELSEATYSALSASVETASAVGFTATATQLATGGFTSSATAVDVLTTALNAYGLEASYAENISDMLITTQNLGKTTVDELAASVGKVIPLASAYGVEMDNLSAAYAELTKGGIATAEAGTYLKSMLNELGDSGSTVSTVLMEETGSSFAELMEMGYSLGDVMDVLGTSVGGSAGAFNELWSSSEAGIGALSLYNAGAEQFNTTLDAMQTSAGATAAAYQTMTDTTAHAQEELSNAAANLQISIGQQINPLIEKLYGLGTNILNFMTEFTQEHPVVTKAIAAIGIGVGVAAIAMVTVTAATTTAIPAIISFGVALNVALGPIGWVAIGITALVAAVAAFIAMNEENLGETEGMTAATRAQYYELQDLNAEYERACEQYGETSEEALQLKNQVDDLSSAFEANRQTVEEFTAEVDALCDSVLQVSSRFNDGMAAIRNNEVGSLALIQKYEDLASQANLTAAQEKQLEAVNQQLAKSYPELAAQLGGAAISTEDYAEAMRRACEQEAEEARQQQAQETYVEALQKRAELTDELAKAQENLNLEQARMDEMSGWEHFWTGGEWDNLKAYQAALDELNAALAENDATITQIEQGWADIADAEAAAADQTVTWQEAVSTAYSEVKARVDELCAAYDEAYQSALESFQGQFGLFDEAKASMDATVANAQAALDSQLAYWENYNANLEALTAYGEGLTGAAKDNYEALLAYVQDGSEEAAGLAGSIADAIASGDGQAVESLAQTISDVSSQQEAAAATTADWVTDFTSQMDEIEQEMQDTVEGMNLSDEAAASAASTITAYADQIRAGKSGAVDAANEVARAVSAALAGTDTSVSVSAATSVPAHANGTTNAESAFIAGENGPELVARKAATYAAGTTNSTDYFIAGENGPELIIGEQGSTVFPAGETDRLIDALNTGCQPLQILAGDKEGDAPGGSNSGTEGSAKETRHIIEVAGGAPIEVSGSGGASKEEIVEVLVAYLRPVLLDLVKSEIFEEGDGSYEH